MFVLPAVVTCRQIQLTQRREAKLRDCEELWSIRDRGLMTHQILKKCLLELWIHISDRLPLRLSSPMNEYFISENRVALKGTITKPWCQGETFSTFSWKLGSNDKSRPCVTQSDGVMHWHHISMSVSDRMAASARVCMCVWSFFPKLPKWETGVLRARGFSILSHLHLLRGNKSKTVQKVNSHTVTGAFTCRAAICGF